MSPLSLDLRRRIIQAWKTEKLRVPELAKRFSVGTATVKRLIRRFRETDSVEPLPHGGGQRPRIPAEKLPLVQRLLEANPDWSVEELTAAYNRQVGTDLSRSTMVRAVARLGFTRKKSPWSPRSGTRSASRSGATASSKRPEPSPLRVWFLWTKPARTRR
jgi:transposase